jgi:hypothetical protein
MCSLTFIAIAVIEVNSITISYRVCQRTPQGKKMSLPPELPEATG